jgi:hypothetical protein
VLAALWPVLDEVLRGFALGMIVGIAVEQRPRGRVRTERGVRDAWALLGAAAGLVVGLIHELS